MKGEKILVVDDSEVTLDVLERNLSAKGFMVTCATGARMAMDILDAEPFDLIITDLKMPDVNGMELVRLARKKHPDIPAMMITGYATIPGAVDAVKGGVSEYLAKPFTKGELYHAVERVMERARAAVAAGRPPARDPRRRFGLIGGSPAMAPVFVALESAAADLHAPVLLVGESGTGHATAARGLASGGPFILEDAASLSRSSLAELEKKAKGGVLYVARLDLAPRDALDFLADWLNRKTPFSARLVAGASPAIVAQVESGSFPNGLYAVFASHAIFLPPLKDREGDVSRLLLMAARRVLGSPLPCWPLFSDELAKLLNHHPWNGNVSELMDTAAHLFSRLNGRPLEPADLPARFAASAAWAATPLKALEAQHIRRVVQSVGGNKSRAAEILQIDRKTLRDKLRPGGSGKK